MHCNFLLLILEKGIPQGSPISPILANLFLDELDEADIVSFDHGFKYLGVIFVKSLIMTPFDKPKKEKKVLYYPPPMNMSAYLLKKKRGW